MLVILDYIPGSRLIRELTSFSSYKDLYYVTTRKSSILRLSFYLSASFSFVDPASRIYIIGSISSIIIAPRLRILLRSLSEFSRLFSIKESPIFARIGLAAARTRALLNLPIFTLPLRSRRIVL